MRRHRHKSFEAFLASALVDTGFIRVARLKKALDKYKAERVRPREGSGEGPNRR